MTADTKATTEDALRAVIDFVEGRMSAGEFESALFDDPAFDSLLTDDPDLPPNTYVGINTYFRLAPCTCEENLR